MTSKIKSDKSGTNTPRDSVRSGNEFSKKELQNSYQNYNCDSQDHLKEILKSTCRSKQSNFQNTLADKVNQKQKLTHINTELQNLNYKSKILLHAKQGICKTLNYPIKCNLETNTVCALNVRDFKTNYTLSEEDEIPKTFYNKVRLLNNAESNVGVRVLTYQEPENSTREYYRTKGIDYTTIKEVNEHIVKRNDFLLKKKAGIIA